MFGINRSGLNYANYIASGIPASFDAIIPMTVVGNKCSIPEKDKSICVRHSSLSGTEPNIDRGRRVSPDAIKYVPFRDAEITSESKLERIINMRRLLVLALCIMSLAVLSAQGQTWGCGDRDFKCQLDGRMKALQTDPQNAENYYNLGIVFQRTSAHKEAVESFSMYIMIPGLKPDFVADGFNNRGISQRALKKPDLAYSDYTKAIELNPKKPEYLVNRGNASVEMKKIDDAMADYAQAIKLDPKYAQAYAQRGIVNISQGRVDDALRDFAKSIEINPAYAEPYYNRGTIYSGKKEFAKAIPDYERYVSLINNPDYLADGYMNLGIAHFYTGNPQKAIDDFTKVIEFQPKAPNGYRARAMVYREMKKTDLAEADERRAAELK